MFLVKCAFETLHNVLADDGEEFPAMEGSTCCEVEGWGRWVRRDYEVLGWSE